MDKYKKFALKQIYKGFRLLILTEELETEFGWNEKN